ncbi:hypothetical protein RIF29_27268 [Crotalaria pallida]|uniref:Uncharacterized protein n=1 Tax=Crotalaria pallida TaxID=3830 RepID=A0AAN9I273_CROPI
MLSETRYNITKILCQVRLILFFLFIYHASKKFYTNRPLPFSLPFPSLIHLSLSLSLPYLLRFAPQPTSSTESLFTLHFNSKGG